MGWVDTGLDFLDDYGGPLISGATTLATWYVESEAADEAAELKSRGITSSTAETDKAAREAIDLSKQQYEQFRTDMSPWREEGGKALTSLEEKVTEGPGEFVKPPGYDFGLKQGVEGIGRRQSARGMLASGQSLKALEEFGQEYGSRQYGDFLNRYYQGLQPLQELAGVGQTATTETGTAGAGYAGTAGSLTTAAADRAASGYTGLKDIASQTDMRKSNIRTGALTDIAGDFAYTLGSK